MEVVRHFNNSLYTIRDDNLELTVSEYEFTQLSIDTQEVRLLKIYPNNDLAAHVRCTFEKHPSANMPTFTAINNARGYRNLREAIEVDGQALFVSVALERFLRYLRTQSGKPKLLWVRYACVVELDPQEQKMYWTREFSDMMYAQASEVIDMHATNGHLIERGYFEIVSDSRYNTWNKVWHRSTDQIGLPRVCPIRLGTRPNSEVPTMNYQYMPLDAITDEIRVMCIMPAEDTDAPVIMHMAHCPIKCEVTYIALSYRWGTDNTVEQVVLNGQRKVIRKNLSEAIRAIRVKDNIVPIWIDALSINQNDVAERNRQVRRMGQIYNYAESVYCYAGSADDETEEVLHFIIELAKHPMVRINDMGEFHFSERGGPIASDENKIKPRQLARLCGILYRFLIRQYFRRSWVLQEIAWASSPNIFVGKNLATHFADLDSATYNFCDMLIRDPSLVLQMQAEDPSLETVDINMLAYPRKLFYFRHLMSNGQDGKSFIQFCTIKETSPGFLETLIFARDFECTDPRDHILALWNLAQDKTGLNFTPGYGMPYEQVYAEFAEAWMKQHRSLDILGAVEATLQASQFYTTVPSWCPNWNLPATASCLVRKDQIPAQPMAAIDDQDGKLYSADGGITEDTLETPIISLQGKALHSTGVIVDQIELILEDAPDIPAGTAPKSNWRAHYWAYKIEEFYRKQNLTTYSDFTRAAWAMFHGDSVGAWPSVAESGYDTGIAESTERYVCLPRLSRHVIVHGNSYDRSQAWAVVDSVLRGRRPFITKNGYMGLLPTYTATPDRSEHPPWFIAVIAGCSVPLLLEERSDATYRLLGTCFVQGWMEGEWMTTAMGADTTEEFWRAIKDTAIIVIT